MKSWLYLENIWVDENVIEFKVTADDGKSRFSNNIYFGYLEI